MEDFAYHRPAKGTEAARLMKKARDGKYLSGGMTLIPTMKLGLASPSDLIDLRGLKNTGISVTAAKVTIKAGTTHAEVAADKGLKRVIPGLSHLAGEIGDPHVRHSGTIGGSIANNDPAADYPAGLVALNAIVHTSARKVAAEKFFTGMFTTVLKPDEIVTQVEFQVPKRSAYMKFPNPASGYAMVGVFVAQHKDGAVRVAVTGAGPKVFRVPEMEQALTQEFSADALSGLSVKPRGLNSDIHATPEYRAHLVGVLARRAVAAAK